MNLASALRRVSRTFVIKNPARHGAALAYYGTFALVPVLAVGYELLTRLLQNAGPALLEEFRSRLGSSLGPELVALLQEQVEAASRRTHAESAWVSWIAFFALIFAASGAFAQLKFSLNSIWEIPYSSQLTTTRQVITRLVGMAMVLGIGLLLVVTVVLSVALGGLSARFDLGSVLPGLEALLSWLLTGLLFALLYKTLPDAPVRWRHALLGGAVSASLVLVALALVSLFFGVIPLTSPAWIGGGLAVILIGINYMAQIFLLGAVIVRLMGEEAGSS
jgi:membrane protein